MGLRALPDGPPYVLKWCAVHGCVWWCCVSRCGIVFYSGKAWYLHHTEWLNGVTQLFLIRHTIHHGCCLRTACSVASSLC